VFEIDFSSDSIESLRVLSLKLPHDTNLLQPDIVALSQFPGRLEAIPGNGSLRLSSRLANGDRIDSIRLQWKDSLRDVESSLEIRFSREFEIIDEALSRLVAAHEAGTASSLSAGVFRRKPVLQELMQVLGLEALQWQPTGSAAMATDRSHRIAAKSARHNRSWRRPGATRTLLRPLPWRRDLEPSRFFGRRGAGKTDSAVCTAHSVATEGLAAGKQPAAITHAAAGLDRI
jgi:hypothetical protein